MSESWEQGYVRQPWLPSESPNLRFGADCFRYAAEVIEETLGALNSEVWNVWWQGHDAEEFRQDWYAERGRLDELRRQLSDSKGRLQQAADHEDQRFWVQERDWTSEWS